jgi:hypothetical protein
MHAGGRLASALAAVFAGTLAIPVSSVSAAPSGGCPYPPNRPALATFESLDSVVAGDTIQVYGTLRQNNCGVRDASVALQRRALVSGVPSGSWRTFASVVTDSSGLYSASRAPIAREQIRAVFNASGRFPAATSSTRAVSVYERVGITVTALSGCRLRVTGSTYPVKAGRTVAIGKRGPAGHFHGWTTLWRVRTGPRGHYSAVHAMRCGTAYNLSSYIATDAVDWGNRSTTVYGARAHR